MQLYSLPLRRTAFARTLLSAKEGKRTNIYLASVYLSISTFSACGLRLCRIVHIRMRICVISQRVCTISVTHCCCSLPLPADEHQPPARHRDRPPLRCCYCYISWCRVLSVPLTVVASTLQDGTLRGMPLDGGDRAEDGPGHACCANLAQGCPGGHCP